MHSSDYLQDASLVVDDNVVLTATIDILRAIADGTGRCWGRNEFGQLGNGSLINANLPQLVTGLTDTIAIGAGSNHTCALISDGSVRCWGANLGGELGNGNTNTSQVPVLVTAISGVSHVTDLSRTSSHGCARISDGSIRCWGNNLSGQVGDGQTNPNGEVTIVDTPATVTVATGSFNSCAVIDDGTVRCWGANGQGQVGNGLTINQPTATPVPAINHVTHLSAGVSHTCVTFVDGTESGAFEAAIQPGRTMLVFAETPANPRLDLVDLDALGAIDRATTVVDSTFATPLGQNPIAHGVDLVVHSATKSIAGHNDATLGVIAGLVGQGAALVLHLVRCLPGADDDLPAPAHGLAV